MGQQAVIRGSYDTQSTSDFRLLSPTLLNEEIFFGDVPHSDVGHSKMESLFKIHSPLGQGL